MYTILEKLDNLYADVVKLILIFSHNNVSDKLSFSVNKVLLSKSERSKELFVLKWYG